MQGFEILLELKQGKPKIDILDSLKITNEPVISLNFNFIGLAYSAKKKYDKAINYFEKKSSNWIENSLPRSSINCNILK